MSEIARLIDQAIRESIAPTLKAHGFRKDGRNFRRREPNCIWIVNVQASAWNSKEEGQFTINLGVHFPALVPYIHWLRDSDRIAEASCTVRARLGHLCPQPRDRWWKVSPTSNTEELMTEMSQLLPQFALPWFEKHSDLRVAREEVLRSHYHTEWFGAAISLALEDRERALQVLSAGISSCKNEHYRNHLIAWGQQHGLLPKDTK